MAVPKPADIPEQGARVAPWRRAIALLFKAALPVAIVAVAAWAAWQVMLTAPDASRRPQTRTARLVEIVAAAPATRPPLVEAFGVVEPARLAVIRPEVSGRVLEVHPELTEGGRIPAGAGMIRIDDTDYRLALDQARSVLAKVEAEIAMELGNQAVARREYQLLGRQLRPEEEALVLRRPQLARLEADRASAEAAIAAAELQIARAVIAAPFDAIVLSEGVDVGSALSAGAEIATLVGTDAFHVMVAVPPAALEWIELPSPGRRGTGVRLRDDAAWSAGRYRTGHVVRLSARLTDTGRMSELVVALDDPLALQMPDAPPVLLGAFLRAEIEGMPVAGGVAIERAALRDGDTVWVMGADDRLEIREVQVAWRGPDRAIVTGGLAAGERVVISQLATVAEGMGLRLRSDPPAVAETR